ncbi:MAG: hypothetical protein PHW63_10615 [Alphaproteobacteria bacterium]|nr:hypothetical protein [Alphaproteobacteria bacterium]
MEDYDIPDVEKIVVEILKGLVKPNQIGPLKLETFDQYMMLMYDETAPEMDLSEYDFIQINRRMGYLTETMTDISGLDVQVWSKTRSRSVQLMNEVTKRILDAEGYTFLGFQIDFAVTLNGPETDRIEMMEETMTSKSFELHIRVNWKD